jgi:glycosyltransferase involved in cell wall biosynthesis
MQHGLLRRAFVDVREMAKQVRMLYDCPELRRKLGRSGVERAKAFKAERIRAQWVKVIREVRRRSTWPRQLPWQAPGSA